MVTRAYHCSLQVVINSLFESIHYYISVQKEVLTFRVYHTPSWICQQSGPNVPAKLLFYCHKPVISFLFLKLKTACAGEIQMC